MADSFTAKDIVTVLGGVGLLATTILTAWAAFRAKVKIDGVKETVDAVKVVNDGQTETMQTIKILVDGRYGEILQKLADVMRLLALETGSKGDKANAVTAQETADAQHQRTASSETKP